MTSPPTRAPRVGILSAPYAATTIGIFALIAFNAFEVLAVATIMPTVSRDLGGFGLYALAFAAPLASSVVGMVSAGSWSDRRGPAGPLVVSLVLFTLGVLMSGLAPTMVVLVTGRVVQGLGTGALLVSLYVVVGVVYPARLQPSIFAAFAAAWVLPALFGPALAAVVAEAIGWRWVFLGIVGLVVLAAVLVAPVVPGLRQSSEADGPAPRSRLAWSLVAAVAVLGVELGGARAGGLLALLAGGVVVVALRPLLPRATFRAGRGLPAVIGTRGLMSGAFLCGQAYIVLVLQDRWGYSPALAGVALSVVGVVWATMSQVQARLGGRVTSETAMRIGAAVLLSGLAGLWLAVRLDGPGVLAGAAYVVAGAAMGFGFTRTGVALLAHSTDADRGFNSSAISIADAIGASLALSLCGIGYELADDAAADPFLVVFGVAVVFAAASVLTASRTRVSSSHPASVS